MAAAAGAPRRRRRPGRDERRSGPDRPPSGVAGPARAVPARPPREGRGAEPYPPSLAPGSEHLDAALRTLELTVRRRLDGLLQGNHLGLVPGPGSEAGDARVYQPGDDVRRMDWSVTARTSEPHIRETIADRELETWLVVDLSPSLDFGTGGCEKRDLAVAACAAVVHLTRGGGNRVGAVVADGERSATVRLPAPRARRHRARPRPDAPHRRDPAGPRGHPGRPRRRPRGAAQPAAAARARRRRLGLPRRRRLGPRAARPRDAPRRAGDRGGGPPRRGAARRRDRRPRRPGVRAHPRGDHHPDAAPALRRRGRRPPRPRGGGAAGRGRRTPAAADRPRLDRRRGALRGRPQARLVGAGPGPARRPTSAAGRR